MKSYYLYTVDGKIIGPMDETAVRSMIEAKILSSETQICVVGEDTWVPLTNLFPIDTPQQSETSPNVANQPNIATSPVSEAAEKPDTAETATPEIKQICKICYEKSLKFTQKIGQRLTPLFQRFIKWLKYQPTEDSQITENPSPEPVIASQSVATLSPSQVPYNAMPNGYISVSEVDPEPMPNLDWAAIERKYWTFKGRIDGKTFLKSFLVSLACQIVGIGLGALAFCGTLYYCERYESRYLKYRWADIYESTEKTAAGYWYIPMGLYCLSAIIFIYGIISVFPPIVRRLQDTGRHWALVILFTFTVLALDVTSLVLLNVWEELAIAVAVFAGFLWVFPGYLLSFLRGQYYPNRFGPKPQAGVTPWKSCKRIMVVGYVALVLWHIIITTSFFIYGNDRKIEVDVDDEHVERVQVRLRNGWL